MILLVFSLFYTQPSIIGLPSVIVLDLLVSFPNSLQNCYYFQILHAHMLYSFIWQGNLSVFFSGYLWWVRNEPAVTWIINGALVLHSGLVTKEKRSRHEKHALNQVMTSSCKIVGTFPSFPTYSQSGAGQQCYISNSSLLFCQSFSWSWMWESRGLLAHFADVVARINSGSRLIMSLASEPSNLWQISGCLHNKNAKVKWHTIASWFLSH